MAAKGDERSIVAVLCSFQKSKLIKQLTFVGGVRGTSWMVAEVVVEREDEMSSCSPMMRIPENQLVRA